MKKLNLLINKIKQVILDVDKNLVLLVVCVIVIIITCGCIISDIDTYRRKCDEVSTQYNQRLDRCEKLIQQLENNYTNTGEY